MVKRREYVNYRGLRFGDRCYGVGGTRGAARRLAEQREESRDLFHPSDGETGTPTRVFKLSSLLSSFSFLFSVVGKSPGDFPTTLVIRFI
jgi:hypothetical protein